MVTIQNAYVFRRDLRSRVFTGDELPTGAVTAFAGAVLPTGWLLCDGTVYNFSAYPNLGPVLGSTWGGNGVTTFAVPDMRGRLSVGAGTGAGLTARTLAANGGEETHILSTAELASHNHSLGSLNVLSSSLTTDNGTVGAGFTCIDQASATSGQSTQPNGTGNGHNTMPPFRVLNYIIKT